MCIARFGVVFLAVAAFTTTEAFAQFPGGGNRGGMGGGMGRDGGARGGGDRGVQRGAPPGVPGGPRSPGQENMATQVQIVLAEIEDALKLSPQQERAWQDYAQKVVALTTDIMREQSRARTSGESSPNALQQIDHLVDVERNRLTALEDVQAAGKRLYDMLGPEQRKLADARIARVIPGPAIGPADRGPGNAFDRAAAKGGPGGSRRPESPVD